LESRVAGKLAAVGRWYIRREERKRLSSRQKLKRWSGLWLGLLVVSVLMILASFEQGQPSIARLWCFLALCCLAFYALAEWYKHLDRR